MSIVRSLARPLLATGFVAAGVDRLRDADATAEQLRPTLARAGSVVPAAGSVTGNPLLVARIVGGTQVGAGLLLGTGHFTRVAGLLLAGTSALNAVVEFKNADADTTQERKLRRAQLLKNLSLIGGVLLAAVDTNGRPGLAWRAGHLASGTRKKTMAVSKDARKQLHAVRSAATDIVGS